MGPDITTDRTARLVVIRLYKTLPHCCQAIYSHEVNISTPNLPPLVCTMLDITLTMQLHAHERAETFRTADN